MYDTSVSIIAMFNDSFKKYHDYVFFLMLLENQPRAIRNVIKKKPNCDYRFPKEERVMKMRGQISVASILILLS